MFPAVLCRFECLKPAARANCWNCKCPVAHNHSNGDRNPSGRLWIDESTGRLCWWCAKGCKWSEVIDATGTNKRDWFPPNPKFQGGHVATLKHRKEPMSKIVKTYDYCDEEGRLLYQVCRLEPKTFIQRRPHPMDRNEWIYSLSGGNFVKSEGKWIASENGALHLDEVKPVLYGLPMLKHSKPEMPVLVVEGEKDADALRALGFLATCNSGGAGKWRLGYGGTLTPRRVVVFPDRDEVGMSHACNIVASAIAFGCSSVRLIRHGLGWEGMPEHSDVSDWLAIQRKQIPQGQNEVPWLKAKVVELVKLNEEWKPCQN